MSKGGLPNFEAPPSAPPVYNQPMEAPPPYTSAPGVVQYPPGAYQQNPAIHPGYPQNPVGYPQQAYPQAFGVPPPQPAINVQVIHATMGPRSQHVTCGQCGAQVMTATTSRPGLFTWLLSSALFVIGCFWGCCLIPCCVPECQDIEHKCPSCHVHLGTYKRL